jgi:hypothetical protein
MPVCKNGHAVFWLLIANQLSITKRSPFYSKQKRIRLSYQQNLKAMKKNLLPTLLMSMMASGLFANTNPTMRYEDKIRIREAIAISNQFGNTIWHKLNDVPFVILLVADSVEFLINHPSPTADFKVSEYDNILQTKILFRPKQFPDWYLATFPAINGINCIVVGTPEKTNKNSTSWVITLLHEHFHQYEYTDSSYYNSVDKLDLSNGDQTGMWQLNYAFPYEDSLINKEYLQLTTTLFAALSNINNSNFSKQFKQFKIARSLFQKLLKPADYRYFSFQLWQEGIASYTEYKFLQSMANFKVSKEMSKLPDYVPFKSYKKIFYESQMKSLANLRLRTEQRVCFYAVGFAEGILLDKLNQKWRQQFLTYKFYLEKYYAK